MIADTVEFCRGVMDVRFGGRDAGTPDPRFWCVMAAEQRKNSEGGHPTKAYIFRGTAGTLSPIRGHVAESPAKSAKPAGGTLSSLRNRRSATAALARCHPVSILFSKLDRSGVR